MQKTGPLPSDIQTLVRGTVKQKDVIHRDNPWESGPRRCQNSTGKPVLPPFWCGKIRASVSRRVSTMHFSSIEKPRKPLWHKGKTGKASTVYHSRQLCSDGTSHIANLTIGNSFPTVTAELMACM